MLEKPITVLTDVITNYIKACGRNSMITRPQSLKVVNLAELKFATTSIGDSINITTAAPSVRNLTSLTRAEGLDILKELKNIKSFNASRKNIELQINGSKFSGEFIGGGGSKSAYRVLMNNEEACILLPSGSWGGALYEAENTTKLKGMGLLTNDYCKIIKVKVDGQEIPALITKPYNSHTFKIFDCKNSNGCLDDYINPGDITEEMLPTICSDLICDVKKLAKNHVVLGSDSINLAFKDGKLRLYLNDLPYEDLIDKTIPVEELAQRYLENALDVMQSRFSFKAYNENATLQNLSDFDFLQKISSKLLK